MIHYSSLILVVRFVYVCSKFLGLAQAHRTETTCHDDISNVWTKLAESNLSQHSQQLDSDSVLRLNMFRHSAHSCQKTLLLGARTSCSREVFCCVPLAYGNLRNETTKRNKRNETKLVICETKQRNETKLVICETDQTFVKRRINLESASIVIHCITVTEDG